MVLEAQTSTRANIITRRTYNRPLNKEGTIFETWEDTVDRVICHQRWLWERALTHKVMPDVPLHDLTEDMNEWIFLNKDQEDELKELRSLIIQRKISPAGRTLWLGNTWVAKNREISMFNCTFINLETVYDVVDMFWALLNGAGVGFRPVPGMLTGFRKRIDNIEFIPSTRKNKGRENNEESWDPKTKTWTISIGDSAEAWAKAVGKVLAAKYPATSLIIDCTEIRPAGTRLRNYGWISQGDKGLIKALKKIVEILNKRADSLLSTIDILDLATLIATVLSTRRSAEIGVIDYNNPDWEAFAKAKNNMWELGLDHRAQSNNSVIFWAKPTIEEIYTFFNMINEGGSGEPGIINGEAMKARAPWAVGLNPCAEILLPNAGLCNLFTMNLLAFEGDSIGLRRAAYLGGRANYRQTCVDLRDNILQEKWHLNNEHLRLCGMSMMGIAARPDMSDYDYRVIERIATNSAYSMANELDTPIPKNVTTVKPEGTISKCFDSTEGIHKPLGKYIFNNIAFSKYDPLVSILEKANYKVMKHPYDDSAVLVTMPVKYSNIEFDIVDGKHVNLDSAVSQLEKYKKIMQSYAHQNVSCTISYSIEETDEIVDWLDKNWDNYVAVSFLFRNDPTKTAKDLGYPYLPQEVVTQEAFEAYEKILLPVDIDNYNSLEELLEDGCANGVCPIR